MPWLPIDRVPPSVGLTVRVNGYDYQVIRLLCDSPVWVRVDTDSLPVTFDWIWKRACWPQGYSVRTLVPHCPKEYALCSTPSTTR